MKIQGGHGPPCPPLPTPMIFCSLFSVYMSKKAFLESFFGRSGFYPAKQSNFNRIQKALIGWKKADPPKSHFVFGHVNRLIQYTLITRASNADNSVRKVKICSFSLKINVCFKTFCFC